MYNKDILLSKINNSNKSLKNYDCIPFTIEVKPRIFSIKSHMQLIPNDKKLKFFKQSSETGLNKRAFSIKNESASLNLTEIYKGSKKRNTVYSKTLNDLRITANTKESYQPINYKIIPKFSYYFVRNFFSLYFLKTLIYDEDFLRMKKIYNYFYHNEIKKINSYILDYPTKLKNRLGNNYVKHFLKKDFNFLSSKYFQYTHKCIYNINFTPTIKTLLPSKQILEEYDYAHKDIIFNKEENIFITKSCELITYRGAIFGDFYIFKNCIIFKSDLENDKRKIKDSLDCA